MKTIEQLQAERKTGTMANTVRAGTYKITSDGFRLIHCREMTPRHLWMSVAYVQFTAEEIGLVTLRMDDYNGYSDSNGELVFPVIDNNTDPLYLQVFVSAWGVYPVKHIALITVGNSHLVASI